ncbi:MAG: patatin-like phospholipase family protein, partial [Candidatus Methylomirabilales bacterium]
GVLARLAEMGLLRRVEVISTVSGGSIIGALYYIQVKQLLEGKPDSRITDADYVALVQRIERDFFAAVQRNFRMRTFLNPMKNFRMSLANYSRSDRIGELYDEMLYRPAIAPGRATPVQMRELLIHPKGDKPDFYPRDDNPGRSAKVPILILNATTLNTGHNWRFEASRMGEPPQGGRVALDVDKNMRLRRPPSYADITPLQQDIELGLAVAASACVPAIFHPLAISGLYDRGIRVQLVDGGVHDNQGVEGLLDERCTHFVVSDASGQMQDEREPSAWILPVILRSNDILMDRVREEELFGLFEAHKPALAFMHLRKGLSAEAIAWIDKNNKPAAPPKTERVPGMPSAQFGVNAEVQDRLSKVRTDLDSFTEIEANSLMLDGYLMSEPEVRSAFSPTTPVGSAPWSFLRIQPWMANPTPKYLAHLEVAHERLFKVFRLSRPVTLFTGLVAVLIVWGVRGWLGRMVQAWWGSSISVKTLVMAAVVLALGFIPWASRTLKVLSFLRWPSEFLVRLVLRGALPAIGSIFVAIHLLIFDRLFLWLGRIQRLG